MIKFGFEISDGKIYDTKIQSYKLVAESVGENIIYEMTESHYKRLYLFEPLLYKYDIETVFQILNFNSKIKEDRLLENTSKSKKLHHINNMATVYNYPPTYLTKRRFYLYKICQNLKKIID